MHVILDGLEKTAMDSWGNLTSLIVFNLFCALSTLPGAAGLNFLAAEMSVLLLGITAVFFLLPGFFIFPLFFTAADLNQGRPAKLTRYFHYLRQTWRQALAWSVINLLVVVMFLWNMVFYSGIAAAWADVVQIVLLSLFVVWCVLQVIMLTLYPRLEKPGFKTVLRHSMAILGQHPLPIVVMVVLTGIVLLLTLFFQFLAFFFSFFAIAMVSSSMVSAIFDGDLHSDVELD